MAIHWPGRRGFDAHVPILGICRPLLEAVGDCTFCSSNPLMGVDLDDVGRVIDHVFIDGFDGETTVARVLDEEFEVEQCGETMTGTYSDHYGVSVTIE